MSHNAFIKGFIDNGCQVEIIMANDSWGEEDSALPKFQDVTYFEYNAVALTDKLRKNARNVIQPAAVNNNSLESSITHRSFKQRLRQTAKSVFYSMVKIDPDYGRDVEWIKNASKFRKNQKYDLVVSNSSPAASHKLVQVLIEKKRIHTERWIQIWEDPWYHDLYGGRPESTEEEEHLLLRSASEVYYVSPLTLMYQKKYYPDCADKMKCVPLPYLEFAGSERNMNVEPDSFGYFGDYYSVTRNIKPFYDALVKSGYKGYINGDTDLSLDTTDKIRISGRVTLDVLSEIQNKTEVLVHLSNLNGGQIPGKIYHYSATTKPILFILDGTEEEKKILLEFFEKYNRYYFCENTVDSILETMQRIVTEKKKYNPVEAFNPKNVTKQILDSNEKTIIY